MNSTKKSRQEAALNDRVLARQNAENLFVAEAALRDSATNYSDWVQPCATFIADRTKGINESRARLRAAALAYAGAIRRLGG